MYTLEIYDKAKNVIVSKNFESYNDAQDASELIVSMIPQDGKPDVSGILIRDDMGNIMDATLLPC